MITVKTISIDAALQEDYLYIDVRTPLEFEEFHIPNAVNVPIFSNEERVIIGTLYKQEGQDVAKEQGIELVGGKLASFYKECKALLLAHNKKAIVVYCWRGGMRSKTFVTCMGLMELPVMQLIGGIRSYREKVVARIEAKPEIPFIVLDGNTGTGKTNILLDLAEKGYPVVDIEGLANHRGSIFGAIGMERRSQKQFDSMLYERLEELKDAPYLIIEGESKRLGNITLPEFLLYGKDRGVRILISAPVAYRVETICEMYQFTEYEETFVGATNRLMKRVPEAIREELAACLQTKDDKRIAELLLVHYYDPRYEYASDQYETEVHEMHVENLADSIAKIEAKLEVIAPQKINI